MRDRAGRAAFGAVVPHSAEIGTQALQGAAGRVQAVVVYKVGRPTRALSDLAKIIDTFDQHGASFVSVTQPFNPRQDRGVGAKLIVDGGADRRFKPPDPVLVKAVAKAHSRNKKLVVGATRSIRALARNVGVTNR